MAISLADPFDMTDEEFQTWLFEVLAALQANGCTASVEHIVYDFGAFYDWAQGDLTLVQLSQIVNRAGRDRLTPIGH